MIRKKGCGRRTRTADLEDMNLARYHLRHPAALKAYRTSQLFGLLANMLNHDAKILLCFEYSKYLSKI